MAFPSIVPFPETAWRDRLVPEEWEACIDAWIILVGAHLSLSSPEFLRISTKDSSLTSFLTSYTAETALSYDASSSMKSKQLRKQAFLLSNRLLEVATPPELLLRWEFLADFSNVYGRNHGRKLVDMVWSHHISTLEASLASLKYLLIKSLEAGLKGDLKTTESKLKRLNHLLHASPEVSAFFMAGSDFLDSLVSCYKLMNPPLRKIIISTTYLCLIGLTEGSKPNISSLVDQLYSLESMAKGHRLGPLNASDSLVAELVTVTPILKTIKQRIEVSGSGSSRAESVLASLGSFQKPNSSARPARLTKRKANKGKGIATGVDDFGPGTHGQVHIHRMSLISQVQDLFPDLGSGFIVKLLDEYSDDVEQTIAHLLEESLPPHLQNADRAESLSVGPPMIKSVYLIGLVKLHTRSLEPILIIWILV